jgi:hypothetical protein
MFLLRSQSPFILYQMSYQWYTLLGMATAIVVGLIVSFLTGARDPREVHRDLLAPTIYRFLPEKSPQDATEEISLKKARC